MYVTRLTLADFRSYAAADVEFAPGPTVVVGLNGQGKTNLVEALVYLAQQSSHRVAKDAPLIRSGAQTAVIGARVQWENRSQSVELELNAGRANRARVAGAPRRPREALGVLRTVLFAPEDLSLVKGEPSGRRRFMDELLVALSPRMSGVLSDYDRVVRQRNALLKTAHRNRGDEGFEATLEVWNRQLAQIGAHVAVARTSVVARLADPVREAYERVAPGGGPARVTYESGWLPVTAPADEAAVSEALLEAIAEHDRAERERGLTLVGPHRDDLLLTLAELPAKGYASHGESWSFALALRLASFDLLRTSFDTGGDPVLVLDDVFAELDTQRRMRLATLVADAEQVIITAAVEEDVPVELRGRTLSVRRDRDSQVI